MAKQLQLRRGTTAQHSTFTGAVGEITVDTDKDVVVVHDGSTTGGFPLAKQSTTLSGYGITNAYTKTEVDSIASGKQATLVSGTNIKTINSTSLLGSGDISVAPLASPTFTGTVTLPSTTSIGNVSATEIGYVDGVTSAIQTQIDGKVIKVSSTDNAIVRFDGTSGAIQNSGVVIDDSGNVGIGVTPNNITPGYLTLQMQASSGLALMSSSNDTHLSTNAYYNGGYLYQTTGVQASDYTQSSGRHYWRTAPSGTAGNAITWTTAMTLTSSGNLLVGTTTDNGVDKLQVNGDMSINGNMLIAATKKIHKVSSGNAATTTLTLTINGNYLYLSGNIDIYYSNIYGVSNQSASRRYILNFSNETIGYTRNLTEIGTGIGTALTFSNFQAIQVSGSNYNFVFTLTFPAGGNPSFIIDGMFHNFDSNNAYNYAAVIS